MSGKKNSGKTQTVCERKNVQGEIMDYTVVYSKDMNSYTSSKSRSNQNREELQRQIWVLMEQGWQPFGSVSVGTTGKNSDTLVFAQAMVKYG